MPHQLEIKYGLTSQELLDAIDKRMRLKVALEGAVAEVHFERKLKVACSEGWLKKYIAHDQDGFHDFTIWTNCDKEIRVEVKAARNGKTNKVELQKTRTSNSDPSSRFYSYDQFDVVAVCMGKRTQDWSEFRYVKTSELPSHNLFENKIKVMNNIVELSSEPPYWHSKLQGLIDAI